MECPLCHSEDHNDFYSDRLNQFFSCNNCYGLFRPADNIPDARSEKARYQIHNNDVNDPGYRNFVRPLVDHVLMNYKADRSVGLDFGAGTGPVIAVMLEELGYQVELYDPYFHPDTSVLERPYDYIICCEVIEHFQDPEKEFKILKELLKPNGRLICKTDIYREGINFERWYYKNDPTHVFIYRKASLQWIANTFDLELEFIDSRSPVFSLPA